MPFSIVYSGRWLLGSIVLACEKEAAGRKYRDLQGKERNERRFQVDLGLPRPIGAEVIDDPRFSTIFQMWHRNTEIWTHAKGVANHFGTIKLRLRSRLCRKLGIPDPLGAAPSFFRLASTP